MPVKVVAALAVVGAVCVLLSTLFGVSRASDGLLDVAQGLFVVAIVIFTAYIWFGIISDARAS